ncbi:MAG: YegP family protein [Lewinella sp.]|nr:YegP family protein [Lewinella sp.]
MLKASNGQVIGKGEMYSKAASMENGIASVKKNADSPTLDNN